MTWRIDQGDCRELLRAMPAESVHCVVTSPPYWGLRDYGLPPLVWGGAAECEHEWGEQALQREQAGWNRLQWSTGGQRQGTIPGGAVSQGSFCRHCHAWRGSLGLEPTPELYIAHMVEVFREVWRVMRKDATLWCNMGDGYASSSLSARPGGHGGLSGDKAHRDNPRIAAPPGLKPKDLCGMPWRLAFALQADGWWLRSEIIWHKPNPMPESVRDRPTKAHETVFLLTKAARYYYDAFAVREACESGPSDIKKMNEQRARIGGKHKELDDRLSKASKHTNIGRKRAVGSPTGRNRRTVWTVATAPLSLAHFASFPPKLIEPMILTSPTKCCAVCGRGWERVTENKFMPQEDISAAKGVRCSPGQKPMDASNSWGGSKRGSNAVTTLGFRPGCECPGLDGDGPWPDLATHPDGEDNWPTKPAVVLDLFCGSGTTPMVALRHGRNAIGLELSEEYAAMARRRIVDDSPLFNHTGG